MLFTVSRQGDCYQALLCEKTTQVSGTSVNKSQVLVKGVMLRQVLFWYFTLTGGDEKTPMLNINLAVREG